MEDIKARIYVSREHGGGYLTVLCSTETTVKKIKKKAIHQICKRRSTSHLVSDQKETIRQSSYVLYSLQHVVDTTKLAFADADDTPIDDPPLAADLKVSEVLSGVHGARGGKENAQVQTNSNPGQNQEEGNYVRFLLLKQEQTQFEKTWVTGILSKHGNYIHGVGEEVNLVMPPVRRCTGWQLLTCARARNEITNQETTALNGGETTLRSRPSLLNPRGCSVSSRSIHTDDIEIDLGEGEKPPAQLGPWQQAQKQAQKVPLGSEVVSVSNEVVEVTQKQPDQKTQEEEEQTAEDIIYLQNSDGLYLTADPQGRVYCVRQRGRWSRFVVEDSEFFRTYHGTYLTASADGKLSCDGKGSWGRFKVCWRVVQGVLKMRGDCRYNCRIPYYFVLSENRLCFWERRRHAELFMRTRDVELRQKVKPTGMYDLDKLRVVRFDSRSNRFQVSFDITAENRDSLSKHRSGRQRSLTLPSRKSSPTAKSSRSRKYQESDTELVLDFMTSSSADCRRWVEALRDQEKGLERVSVNSKNASHRSGSVGYSGTVDSLSGRDSNIKDNKVKLRNKQNSKSTIARFWPGPQSPSSTNFSNNQMPPVSPSDQEHHHKAYAGPQKSRRSPQSLSQSQSRRSRSQSQSHSRQSQSQSQYIRSRQSPKSPKSPKSKQQQSQQATTQESQQSQQSQQPQQPQQPQQLQQSQQSQQPQQPQQAKTPEAEEEPLQPADWPTTEQDPDAFPFPEEAPPDELNTNSITDITNVMAEAEQKASQRAKDNKGNRDPDPRLGVASAVMTSISVGSLTSELARLDQNITALQAKLKNFWDNRTNKGWQARETEQHLQQSLQYKIQERLAISKKLHTSAHCLVSQHSSLQQSFQESKKANQQLKGKVEQIEDETAKEEQARKELTMRLVQSLDKADALNKELDRQHFTTPVPGQSNEAAFHAQVAQENAELNEKVQRLKQGQKQWKREAKRVKKERDRLQQQQLAERNRNVQLQNACAQAWKDIHAERSKYQALKEQARGAGMDVSVTHNMSSVLEVDETGSDLSSASEDGDFESVSRSGVENSQLVENSQAAREESFSAVSNR